MVANFGDASVKRLPNAAAKGNSNRWCPPSPGWFKINSDGAASLDENWSAAVGVVRDSKGQWDVGYQKFVGRGSALNSELWAILHGVQLAKH